MTSMKGTGMQCIGLKWLRYEMPRMRWIRYEVHWYEVILVWNGFNMKWRIVWSDNRYEVTGMKCCMVCSALVWSAWYVVVLFPFGMKWLKKWNDDWMKWLGTIFNKFPLINTFSLSWLKWDSTCVKMKSWNEKVMTWVIHGLSRYNVLLTELQGPILPWKLRDHIHPNHAF